MTANPSTSTIKALLTSSYSLYEQILPSSLLYQEYVTIPIIRRYSITLERILTTLLFHLRHTLLFQSMVSDTVGLMLAHLDEHRRDWEGRIVIGVEAIGKYSGTVVSFSHQPIWIRCYCNDAQKVV